MNELHKKLREDAETLLDEIVDHVQAATVKIMSDHTTDVDVDSILRLAIGGRTTSIRKKVVSILAAEREKKLLKLYQETSLVPTVTDIKSGKTGW